MIRSSRPVEDGGLVGANVDISEELGVHVDVVSRWRKRFCAEGMAGLDDRPRSGASLIRP